ncbi:MAG: hypothetical protein JW902_00065 [Syntrophaceae bacterium]|nr:hypothetical protein [Syntrophaceae bacterium]
MKRFLFLKCWILVTGIGILFYTAQSTPAATTTQYFQGTVTSVVDDGANPFGLSVNDPIYLKAVFDPVEVTSSPSSPGSEDQLLLVDYTGWDFRITLGSYTFSQGDLSSTDQDDTNFWFFEGAFDGIEFYHTDDIGSYSDVALEHFNAARSMFAEWDGGDYSIEADWDFTPVPVPGTILLLGPGLLGVVQMRKKFRLN